MHLSESGKYDEKHEARHNETLGPSTTGDGGDAHPELGGLGIAHSQGAKWEKKTVRKVDIRLLIIRKLRRFCLDISP
jgi:hypothetical protein